MMCDSAGTKNLTSSLVMVSFEKGGSGEPIADNRTDPTGGKFLAAIIHRRREYSMRGNDNQKSSD
jgi:hypothetical protein